MFFLNEAKTIIKEAGNKLKLPKYLIDSINIEGSKSSCFFGRASVIPLGNEDFQLLIELSENLFKIRSYSDNVETIVHELCHIADWHFNGNMSGHRKKWKELMGMCGFYNPKSCDYIPSGYIPNRVKTYCSCPVGVYITKNRATRIKNGQSYRCLKCSQKISLVA